MIRDIDLVLAGLAMGLYLSRALLEAAAALAVLGHEEDEA